MNLRALQDLFTPAGVFDHTVTLLVTITVAALLVIAPVAIALLGRSGVLSEKTRADMRTRTLTWMVIAPAALGPILWSPGAAMVMLGAASLLCYREYARATGLFRHRLTSALVALAILTLLFASLDHYYRLFAAVSPMAVAVIAGANVLQDQPKGYIQRVALGAVGLLLFGTGLMHLAFLANDLNYRPVLLLLIFCVQLSDIAAYCCGKAFGRRKAFPNTSPNKTLGGHIGALLITAPLAAYLAHLVFEGTAMNTPLRLGAFGVIVAVGGQLGDLVLGSIKRDLGIKDMSATLPGHGGFSDRCNSLLLVAPAAFHFINYFVGVGLDRPVRILTGGAP